MNNSEACAKGAGAERGRRSDVKSSEKPFVYERSEDFSLFSLSNVRLRGW